MRVFTVFGIALALLAMGSVFTTRSAEAVIHEIVAAYCSGGDVGVIDGWELEPPPIANFSGEHPSSPQAIARPVLANGSVDVVVDSDGNIESVTISDKQNAKFPAGSNAFTLDVSDVDHPSKNCKKFPG